MNPMFLMLTSTASFGICLIIFNDISNLMLVLLLGSCVEHESKQLTTTKLAKKLQALTVVLEVISIIQSLLRMLDCKSLSTFDAVDVIIGSTQRFVMRHFVAQSSSF